MGIDHYHYIYNSIHFGFPLEKKQKENETNKNLYLPKEKKKHNETNSNINNYKIENSFRCRAIKTQENNTKELLNKIKEKDNIISIQEQQIEKQNNIINRISNENQKNKENQNKEFFELKQQLQKMINEHENVIRKNNDQISDDKKQIDELNKIIATQKAKDDENKKEIKKLDDSLKEQEKKLKNMQDKIRRENDEKKKKELQKQKEKEEKKILFKKEFNSFISKKIEIIIKDIKISHKNFCKNDMNRLNYDKAKNLVILMFKKDQILDPIYIYLKSLMKESLDKVKTLEHLNILLVGPAGVGKTTLINAQLKVNLPTGFGCPITKKIESYTSEEIPFLRLIDSKGIEKSHGAGVDFIFREISNYIKSQNDPDKYVHCIWYCWTGTRLEGVELELLKKLSKQYSLKKLPIIIVYTQAIEPEKIENEKEYFKKLNIENDFVEVLAKKAKTGHGNNINEIKPFGLDKLTELSIEKAKNAVDSACYEGLIKDLNANIKKKLDNIVRELKRKIDIKIEKILPEIDKDIDIQNLRSKLIELIVEIFNNFFYLSSDIKISEKENYKATIQTRFGNLYYRISQETSNNITNFVLDYLKEFTNLFDKNYIQLVNDYTTKFSQDVKNFRNEFIATHKDFDIDDSDNLIKELSKSIKGRIFDSAQKIAFKNLFLNIITPIVSQSKLLYENLYKEAIERDNFKEEGKKMVKISFDKIEEKIIEYNGKKKNQDKSIDSFFDNFEKFKNQKKSDE